MVLFSLMTTAYELHLKFDSLTDKHFQ